MEELDERVELEVVLDLVVVLLDLVEVVLDLIEVVLVVLVAARH
jgi:hypothetical protein